MNLELENINEAGSEKNRPFDQVGRERAHEIVGRRKYILRQVDIMKEWLAENPGVKEEDWEEGRWSDAYAKAVLDIIDNSNGDSVVIASKLEALEWGHLTKFL